MRYQTTRYQRKAGDASGLAKTRDGTVEAIRVLRIARCSARTERTRAINQIRSIICTAPEELRAQFRGLVTRRVVGFEGESAAVMCQASSPRASTAI